MARNISGLKRGGPGRPKGLQNKATREIKAIARAILDDPEYVSSLRQRMIDGKAPHMETLYHHYVDGKPKETFSVETAPPVMVIDELTLEDVEQKRRERDDGR